MEGFPTTPASRETPATSEQATDALQVKAGKQTKKPKQPKAKPAAGEVKAGEMREEEELEDPPAAHTDSTPVARQAPHVGEREAQVHEASAADDAREHECQ
ncbi:hypothetical protein GUITHDRAFT_102427 [Guillardia theta CCMP2712]|uniref:Uncharacterized protein n=1 Tax=Guillardia theta (strain CCMP2712) TaxID=905079 RepID=L1JTE6_GUITC|nr:hypothetical protein GUITHDRAFT_102427 [Guillardia theta CCMP2712]EKX51816.1 hypothetical protein GUITHDRAFT_102427 [Guillardia theta CCMP2712]|eukprot:XP_005838796.1 hypothetical protein GUITHDRAFT_102427 [Guillardia theta CCMP2712]